MDELKKIPLESLHHAYILPSTDAEVKQKLHAYLSEKLGIPVQGNPDVLELNLDTLTIHDARFLIEQASHTPLGEAKFFIVSFSFAGDEAQNALLKLLEEPTPRTHFFILVPSLGTLLETVRSRLSILTVPSHSTDEIGKKFIEANPKERVALAKSAIEEKDKTWALALVSSLEHVLHKRLLASPQDAKTLAGGEALISARRYLEARSASVKMILEYLAASLSR
jgi:hypothetical protein